MRELLEAIKNCQLGIKQDHTGWQAYANGPLAVILLWLLAVVVFRAI
jgi:hypothetical protein